jgi:hypothetical protein
MPIPAGNFIMTCWTDTENDFGKPDRWRGDPFHVLVAWKWSFTDKEGNRISMILQHNIEDTTRKIGNAVKLSMLNFEEEEIQCFEKKESEIRDLKWNRIKKSGLSKIGTFLFHDRT